MNSNQIDLRFVWNSMVAALAEKYQVSAEVALEAMELQFGIEISCNSLAEALEEFHNIDHEIIDMAALDVEKQFKNDDSESEEDWTEEE